jgi:hypothetical protein
MKADRDDFIKLGFCEDTIQRAVHDSDEGIS